MLTSFARLRTPLLLGALSLLTGCASKNPSFNPTELETFLAQTMVFSGLVPSPVVQPFGDNKAWVTVRELRYVVGESGDAIVVPAGFVTDFASIPEALWSFGLSPHGQYSRAALIHDYLYWSQGCSREQADRLMLIAMKESRVTKIDEAAIYAAVRTFGDSAWSENSKERALGMPRVLPKSALLHRDPNADWPSFRRELLNKRIGEPAIEKNLKYCVHGNSTNIPVRSP
jgi:Protein of unknown function (DUF1353)